MKKFSYQEAYDKIVQAYFKDEVRPLEAKFCFCGTLCNNTSHWFGQCRKNHSNSHGYSGVDFVKMEKAFLDTISEIVARPINRCPVNSPLYEKAIFEGMCAALGALREIHIGRGENVDNAPVFTKRILQTQKI